MIFRLNEDQLALQRVVSDFAATRLEPFAAKWDEEKIFPAEILQEAAALGLAGIFCDPDYGGSGLGRLDGAVIFEALSRGCTTSAAYLSIHNMVARLLDRYGSIAQKDRWLADLCTMKSFASYCLTEPGAGSDAASLTTKAVKTAGGDYRISGSKMFISGGGRSDLYLVMARTGEGSKGISSFLIEHPSKGLSFGKQERKLGWNAQPTAMVILEDCLVPAEQRLAEEGQGFNLAMQGLDGGRVNIAACSLGTASIALEQTIHYLKTRRQFGKTIGEFQGLQFRLADMATELEAARLMTYRAGWSLDEAEAGRLSRQEAAQAAAMAKRFTTDVGFQLVNQALQMHGGYGYLKDFPFERYVRDLRVHQILEGTNEIMRVIIARQLLS